MLASRFPILAGAVAGLLFTVSARADAQSLITSPLGGAFATSFGTACPVGPCVGPAPISVGTGGHDVTISTTNDNYLIDSGTYSLGGNGVITGGHWATVGASEGFLTFDFESPVTWVGGLMSYRTGPGSGAPWLIAWNGSVLLGGWNLAIEAPINTPGATNELAFRGVEYAGGITRLQLSGGHLVTRDLQATSYATAVPEPAALVLLVIGTLLMSVVSGRRRTA
jgi:hypothetical protein